MQPLEVNRRHEGKTARVVVTRGSRGWDLREELGDRIVKETTYTDWHRVERAMMVFELRDALAAYSTKR